MADLYYVRIRDMETGEETVSESWWREIDAVNDAERQAMTYFGAETTWFDNIGDVTYQVGRLLEDGSRSKPLVTITIEGREDVA